jgi:putative flippase GtrA
MRHLKHELACYIAVSAFALVVDTCILLLLAAHTHYLVAATAGFLTGSLVHYVLAVKLVFKTRRLGDKTHLEVLIYFATGLLGLLVNTGIIYLGVEWLHTALLPAKLLAAGASFATGYLTRKLILFSARTSLHAETH